MATATSSAPLSAEPSNPDEPTSQHLEPKSYVDAVQEAPQLSNGSTDTSDGQNGVNGVNGVDGESQDKHANDGLGGSNHHASILRIVDTHGEGDTTMTPPDKGINREDDRKPVANGESNSQSSDGTEPRDQSERPDFERQESKHEYSATGLDETPKTPPRHKHRKTPSLKANNGAAPNAEKTTTFEKLGDHENGNHLTSVKPSGNYEKSKARTNSERVKADKDHRTLVSGRQAGKRWKTSGIRFAPMNVPLQRRLQTLMVLFHSTCIALCVSTFFFLCAIPIFWPLLIVYMIYCMSSNAAATGTLNHRSNFFRASPLWSLFASYFPARLHRSEELPATRKYIFGYHPHGIISHGAFAAFGTEALGFSQLFPGITNTLLTLDSNFRIPIYRDYALAMGLASVSRESCENLLSKGGPNGEGMGRAITIVVGGARESLDAQPYYMRLVLKRRKGFVKMALRTGADLVPVLGFGENDLYDQVTSASHPSIHKAQLLVKKILGFTIPLFHARGVFNYDVGLMPYRRPLNIVVGRAIKVTQSSKPTQEEIDKLHEEYVKELKNIWELWKGDFARDRKGELEIDE